MGNPPLNIILFGETGHGKSSLINLIAGQQVADTSSSAEGCTMDFQRYPFLVNGRNVQVWDTVGLNDSDMEIKALELAYKLIQDLQRHGGVDLLLFCIRAPRITATMQANYQLFHGALCRSLVPVALAITNLENEIGDMENWWTRNVRRIEELGFSFAAHVCVTGLLENVRYLESRKRVWDLLQAHSGERFTMSSEAWFVGSLPLFNRFVPSKRRKALIKLLVKECEMDQGEAEKLAAKLIS